MSNSVLIKNDVAATDVRTYNRSAYYTAGSLANGNVFRLETLVGLSGCEVWAVTKSNGSAADMWMAGSEDVNVLASGNLKYRGLDVDPVNFYISACAVFDAFKPQVGDIMTLTAEAFNAARSTETFANSYDNAFNLDWAAAKAGSSLTLKLIDITTISKPLTGNLGDTQRTAAYKMQVVANPTVD